MGGYDGSSGDSGIEELVRDGTAWGIRAAIADRRVSAREVAEFCLARLHEVNGGGPRLNAVRTVSDSAIDEAARLDRDLAAGVAPGLLHGVPILLKDNILTGDGQTASAGAAALRDFVPRRDASLVSRLRRAGAVILGKTNMTEFADYVSDVMPSEYSGAGGVVGNPHGISYGRGGGSSVGSAAAVAAGIVPIAFGTETQNSIQSPACNTSLVGFKPSVGQISRAGIVPLVPSQDSPGPLTRCVADAALAYSAVAGADPDDALTLIVSLSGMERMSDAADPRHIRIGVPRIAMAERLEAANGLALFESSLSRLSRSGFQIVDPCDLPSAERMRDVRSSVFPTEFKASLNAFLAANHRPCGIGSLDDLILWNEEHPDAIPHGQSLLLAARDTGGLDDPRYRADRRRDLVLSRAAGIDAAIEIGQVDVLIAPMAVAAKCTGKAGAPVVAIPVGLAGTGAPFGITLFAPHGHDRRLLSVARAVERAIGDRRVPAI